MNHRIQQRVRSSLEQIQDRLRPDVVAMAEQARGPSGGQAASDLTNLPMHLGDMGTEEYLHDLNATLLVNEEYLLEEVEAALARLDDGTYGTCESCNQPIANERLEALPYARECVRCAAAEQDSPEVNLNAGRPRTESDTLAPEGEMGESRRRKARFSGNGAEHPTKDEADDIHAAGTAGGGTAVGGLAGTTNGHGDPEIAELQNATGSSEFDASEDRETWHEPQAGRRGGAIDGTPASRRPR